MRRRRTTPRRPSRSESLHAKRGPNPYPRPNPSSNPSPKPSPSPNSSPNPYPSHKIHPEPNPVQSLLCTNCTRRCARAVHALCTHSAYSRRSVLAPWPPHLSLAVRTTSLPQVKSTELVLRPATAVVSVPLSFTVSLDAQGGVYDNVILAFIPGGAAVSGQEGGCQEAPTAPLRAVVDTYTGVVQLGGMVFDEATDYGVCFLVNASSAFLVEQVS